MAWISRADLDSIKTRVANIEAKLQAPPMIIDPYPIEDLDLKPGKIWFKRRAAEPQDERWHRRRPFGAWKRRARL